MLSDEIIYNSIDSIVAKVFRVSKEDIYSKSREARNREARFTCVHIVTSLRMFNPSLKAIGEHYGGRDHSTIINARDKIKDDLERPGIFRERVEYCMKEIIKELQALGLKETEPEVCFAFV